MSRQKWKRLFRCTLPFWIYYRPLHWLGPFFIEKEVHCCGSDSWSELASYLTLSGLREGYVLGWLRPFVLVGICDLAGRVSRHDYADVQSWPTCASQGLRLAGHERSPRRVSQKLVLLRKDAYGWMPILDYVCPLPCGHCAVHTLRTAGPVREACCVQSRGVYSYGPFAQVILYGLQGTERVAQRPQLGQACIALIVNDFR